MTTTARETIALTEQGVLAVANDELTERLNDALLMLDECRTRGKALSSEVGIDRGLAVNCILGPAALRALRLHDPHGADFITVIPPQYVLDRAKVLAAYLKDRTAPLLPGVCVIPCDR